MNDGAVTRRSAAAHVLVADVEAPVIDDHTARHLFDILRIKDGATVTVTDGRGSWRVCRAMPGTVVAEGPIYTEALRGFELTIATAIPKLDRPEWIVQKLTELGVDRIIFLHAERSVVRWDAQRAEKHLAKLRKVAVEALEQSRSVWLPVIEGPVRSDLLLPRAVATEPGGRELASGDHTLAIGPEGGWSQTELELATAQVELGANVLRVETAAVVAATQLISCNRPI